LRGWCLSVAHATQHLSGKFHLREFCFLHASVSSGWILFVAKMADRI